MKRFLTDGAHRFAQTGLQARPAPTEPEMRLVKVYPDLRFQRVIGFGAALTEASGWVFAQMPPDLQGEFARLCFGRDGNRYSLGRVSVQSCDFSLGPRAYAGSARAADGEFSIDGDFAYVIPLALAAVRENPALELLASPWSPPAWAKTNGSMLRGGSLRRSCYGAWAEMIARFVREYRALGLAVTRLTVQNEPNAAQTWESCRFTGGQEREFLTGSLKPALAAAGLGDVKVLGWDHNKEGALDRAAALLAGGGADALDGIAFHWYSGDHFEALRVVRDVLGPDRELIFSEGCDAFSGGDPSQELPHAEHYAHEVIGDLETGANGIFDWNVLLDERGGPNHVGNFCDAPIMYDVGAREMRVRLPFFYLGHFSRYVLPGARRVLSSRYTTDLETCAFANPDGTFALVALNRTDRAIPFDLTWGSGLIGRRIVSTEAPPHSIQTLVW